MYVPDSEYQADIAVAPNSFANFEPHQGTEFGMQIIAPTRDMCLVFFSFGYKELLAHIEELVTGYDYRSLYDLEFPYPSTDMIYSDAYGLFPIANYDFVSGSQITPIASSTPCGTYSAGVFDTSGQGKSTPNSLHKDWHTANQRCIGNSFIATPLPSKTWLSVTEIRYWFKQDFPLGGSASNNWMTVSVTVFGSHNPGGSNVYFHTFQDQYDNQMQYYQLIIPINYLFDVTKIEIDMTWEHVGGTFDDAPGSYLADFQVFGIQQ